MKRAVAVAALLMGCAAPIDVERAVTPSEAVAANGTSFHATAILRGEARAALPEGVTVDPAPEVVVPRPGTFTYALDPGETVVRDKQGRIVGVSTPPSDPKGKPHVTRFVAGTAELDGNEVHGELEGHVERVPLLPGDRIELRGRFGPGQEVPTGGRVVTTRAFSALAFGGVLLGGAWLPSVIVAASSSVDANHWLYVPVVGPWIAYGTRDACAPAVDPRPCLNDAGERIGIIADGVLQSTGAVLLVVGLPSSAEVRWGKQARVRIGPAFGRFAGLSVDGRF
jgi:hypothetical protein